MILNSNRENFNIENRENLVVSKEFNKPGTIHFFTTREFGHVDIDDPQVYKKIIKFLGNPSAKIVFAGQPHGKEIAIVTNDSPSVILGFDGLITTNENKNIALVIRTSDCLPILTVVTDKNKNPIIIGALHAGRRGLVSGIIENFISIILEKFNSNVNNVYCLIGPHICEKCYSLEKNNEQTQNLIEEVGESYFSLSKKEKNKVYLNMFALARDKFKNKGVPPSNIHDIGICVYENHDIFPSFRYNQENKQKNSLFASVIAFTSVSSATPK